MPTLGEKLIDRFPDQYGDRDPSDLNASVITKLNDPAMRGPAVAHLRALFPAGSALDDDAFVTHALHEATAGDDTPSPVVKQPAATEPVGMDPAQAVDFQRMSRLKNTLPTYKTNVKTAMGYQQDPLAQPDAKKEALDLVRNSVSPMEALPDAKRIPEFWDMREMQKAAKDQGLTITNQGEGLAKYFPNIQMQNKAGVALGQLRPGASYDPSTVENMPAATADTVTGASDPFQRGVTWMLKNGVYNPETREVAGMHNNGGPVDQGFREYGRDVGGNMATSSKAAGTAMRGAADVASMALAPVAGGLGVVDKMEQWLNEGLAGLTRKTELVPNEKTPDNPRGLGWKRPDAPQQNVFDRWGKENDKESSKYFDVAKSLARDSMPGALPRNEESDRAAGEALGQTAGEVASLVTPTGIGMAAKPVLSVAAPVVDKAYRHALAALERGNVKVGPYTIEHGLDDVYHSLGGMFSNNPSAAAVPTKAGREALDASGAVMRNAGELHELEQSQRIMRDIKAALPAGTSDDTIRQTLMEAQDAWHSPDARKAAAQANPLLGKVYDVLQPEHEQVFRNAYGDRAYNPYHVMFGQDISKSNRIFEKRFAQHAEADAAAAAHEAAAGVGDMLPLDPSVPGIGSLGYSGGGQYQPRAGRARADLVDGYLKQDGSIKSGMGRDLKDRDALGGIVGTGRELVEGRGLRTDEQLNFINSVLPDIQKADKHEGALLEQYFQRPEKQALLNGQPIHSSNPDVNVIRQAQGGQVFSEAAEKALRADDKVVLYINPKADMPKDISNLRSQNRVSVTLPGGPGTEGLNGRVFDRRFVQALVEQQNPSAMMQSARKMAYQIDKIAGLSQFNKAVTRGNPGFEARNRTSEGVRAIIHDPSIRDQRLQDIVREVSNTPIGQAGPMIPELGMSAGEAHRQVLSLGSVGRGLSAEAAGLEKQLPGAIWQTENMRKAVDLGTKAGEAVGDLHNLAWRKAWFPDLAKQYSTEDGMRFAVMLNEMRHGVAPHRAANTMRGLLIDFGDRNVVETALKPFVPFIKYYTGALEGVAKLAAEDPRRFSRVYDIMRAAENWDTTIHGDGKAINRKFKSLADRAAGAPIVEANDGSITVHRPETTAAEAASLADAIHNTYSGKSKQGDKGIYSVLGPLATTYYSMATGVDPSTDRNVFGLKPDEFEKVGGLRDQVPPAWGPLRQARMAIQAYQNQKAAEASGLPYRQTLGASPRATTAFNLVQALKGVPGLDTPARMIGAPWVQTMLRAQLGTGNPASRSDEKVNQVLTRFAESAGTGMRSSTIDPTDVMSKDQRRLQAELPTLTVKKLRRSGKQGELVAPRR